MFFLNSCISCSSGVEPRPQGNGDFIIASLAKELEISENTLFFALKGRASAPYDPRIGWVEYRLESPEGERILIHQLSKEIKRDLMSLCAFLEDLSRPLNKVFLKAFVEAVFERDLKTLFDIQNESLFTNALFIDVLNEKLLVMFESGGFLDEKKTEFTSFLSQILFHESFKDSIKRRAFMVLVTLHLDSKDDFLLLLHEAGMEKFGLLLFDLITSHDQNDVYMFMKEILQIISEEDFCHALAICQAECDRLDQVLDAFLETMLVLFCDISGEKKSSAFLPFFDTHSLLSSNLAYDVISKSKRVYQFLIEFRSLINQDRSSSKDSIRDFLQVHSDLIQEAFVKKRLDLLERKVRACVSSLFVKIQAEASQRCFVVEEGQEGLYGLKKPQVKVIRRFDALPYAPPSVSKVITSKEEADYLVKTLYDARLIPWEYKLDGCSYRARIACEFIEKMGVLRGTIRKIFAEGALTVNFSKKDAIFWKWHIAPMVIDSSGHEWVIDPSLSSQEALTPKNWRDRLTLEGRLSSYIDLKKQISFSETCYFTGLGSWVVIGEITEKERALGDSTLYQHSFLTSFCGDRQTASVFAEYIRVDRFD